MTSQRLEIEGTNKEPIKERRMESQCLDTKGTKKEHRQKLRWCHNDEKQKKQSTNPRYNIG